MDTIIQTASKSEKGMRVQNEDACLFLSSAEMDGALDALMIVADGMGGRASGAAASRTAVAAVREFCELHIESGEEDLAGILVKSIQSANEAVLEAAASKPELQGMGTTCVVAAIKGDTAYYAYLGDSRAYLLREGCLERLTEDHSYVAEKVKSGEITEDQARTSRFRNVITKAVGIGPNAEPDSGSVEVTKGDVILLCTDGLTTAVHDKAIADILCTSSKPKEACDRLVELALNNGGRDNITVVVGALGEEKVTETRTETRYTPRVEKQRGGWIIPALISLFIGIGIGLCLLLVLKPEPVNFDTPPPPIELSHLGYGAPEPLLSHIPLSGKYILLDQHGYIYVVNQAGKVLRVDTSGRIDTNYVSSDTFKLPANAPSPMLATDPQGNLYFSDPAARKIMKFSTGGQFITSIGSGKLTAPESLAVDSQGNIFVIDSGRLKVIRPKPAEPATEK